MLFSDLTQPIVMMRPNASVEKVYLYPEPVDIRKSIDGLAALVELDIKVAVFDPVLLVFLNRHRNRVKVLYWERNGFCLWLKRLESERFKTSPNASDAAIVLTVQELNWLLDGLYTIYKPHLPNGWSTVYCGISGEQFRGSSASYVCDRRGVRQPLQYVAQPHIGLLAVDLGGLDQAVDLCTGRGALGCVAEQPRLAPDDKRLYRTFRQVVVD